MNRKRISENNLTIYEKKVLSSVLDKLREEIIFQRWQRMRKKKRKKEHFIEDYFKLFSAIDSIKNKLRLYKKIKKKK